METQIQIWNKFYWKSPIYGRILKGKRHYHVLSKCSNLVVETVITIVLHMEKADYEPFIDITSVKVQNAITYMEKIFNNLKFQ